MLLTFIIFSIIFSFLLYIIEIYYKKSTSNIAIIKTISFLILSIILFTIKVPRINYIKILTNCL